MSNYRTPDEIMADFDTAVQGRADIDPHEILWEILDDALSSMRLALPTLIDRVDEHDVQDIDAEMDSCINEVRDYLVNHYGD